MKIHIQKHMERQRYLLKRSNSPYKNSDCSPESLSIWVKAVGVFIHFHKKRMRPVGTLNKKNNKKRLIFLLTKGFKVKNLMITLT